MEGRPRGESGSIRFAVEGKIFRSAAVNRFLQLCIKKIQQCQWDGVRNDDGVSVTQIILSMHENVTMRPILCMSYVDKNIF